MNVCGFPVHISHCPNNSYWLLELASRTENSSRPLKLATRAGRSNKQHELSSPVNTLRSGFQLHRFQRERSALRRSKICELKREPALQQCTERFYDSLAMIHCGSKVKLQIIAKVRIQNELAEMVSLERTRSPGERLLNRRC